MKLQRDMKNNLLENISRLKSLMKINEATKGQMLDIKALKFYEEEVPTSTDVIEVAESWEGGGYIWGSGSGLGIPLMWTNPDTGQEEVLKDKKKTIVGLIADPERLMDIRKNRLNTLSEEKHTSYVDLERIKEELEESRKIFKANNIPTIDVTRKSVEETAASIIKIHEIKNS